MIDEYIKGIAMMEEKRSC